MTIVFIRHAHRDTSERDIDNGISTKGRDQVKKLIKRYESGKLPPGEVFWTSPKKRCLETLTPVASRAAKVAVVEALLDEQSENEDRQDFSKRITELIEKVSKENQTVYLCSHGDFIPLAIEMLSGNSVDVSKGEAVVLESNDRRWSIK